MRFSLSNRALLQSMIASALVVAGATACSRTDRTESGSDNTAALTQDTTNSPGDQSSATTSDMRASSDTAPARVPSNAPRAATAPAAGEGNDTAAAAYREMQRDTVDVPESDSARVTADSSETSQNTVDTNSVETANAALPSDTVAIVTDEDTTAAAGYVAMARDTSAAVDQTDTTAAVATTEDSTELLGEVNSHETADEEPVAATEQDTSADRETVAASESRTDEVGAAAIGGTVTGSEAVALVSRQGLRCAIVDPESNEAVRWDMSSTPVTLNPCGMGSMVLSRIWTGGE